MHKLSSSGVLRDGVARLQAPGGANVRVEMSHPPQNRRELACYVRIPCRRVDAQPPVQLLLAGLAVPLTFQWTGANKTASEHRTKQAEDGLNAAIHRIHAQDDALYTVEDGRYVYDCTLRVQAGRGTLTCKVRRTCDVDACSRALYQYLGAGGLLLQFRGKNGRRRNSYVRHKLELEPLPGWLRLDYEAQKLDALVKIMSDAEAGRITRRESTVRRQRTHRDFVAQRLFLHTAVRHCALEQAREVVLPRAVLKACTERAGVLCLYVKPEALAPG